MRTTIDSAGRVVIPKRLREEAGLHGGAEVEIELREGRIEIDLVAEQSIAGAACDAIVAATTVEAGATLVTRDRRTLATYQLLGVSYRLIG